MPPGNPPPRRARPGKSLARLRRFFPPAALRGTPVRAEAPAVPGAPVPYGRGCLSRGVAFAGVVPCAGSSSRSGSGYFANTVQGVAGCALRRRAGGPLLISNSTRPAVRARLVRLPTGRVRRAKLLFKPTECYFRLVPRQVRKRLFYVRPARVWRAVVG